MTIPSIEIHALTPERRPDFLDFFDHRAFIDNPRWQSCYCHFPHANHARIVWNERTAAQNRAATCDLIASGTMTGWLAYADGQVIGWCNAGARRFIDGLFDEPEPLADRIGALSCFVVAPGFRRRGIASSLLQAACDGLRERGFDWAEAYPREAVEGAADNHHGPLEMFLAAGFDRFKGADHCSLKVRKRLSRPDAIDANRKV